MVSLNGTTTNISFVADSSATQLVKRVGVVTMDNGWNRDGRAALDGKWSDCIQIDRLPATKRDMRRHGYRRAR